MWWSKLFLVLAFVPALVHSLAATDEVQDAVRTMIPFSRATES